MNKIIKTYHTPFWNPLETFSSWIRSIRAKVEKQLPHINTLWVFSLCLNLRTLPAIEKGGAWWTRQTRVSSLTQREFILPVLHSAAWRTTTSQHVYYMVSFFTCKFHRGLWESCLYAFEMKESWFAENDNECIFFFRLRKPYRCECFLFQNISVTLALSIPMPFQFEALYSVSSHQKYIECFACFRF